MVGPRKRKGKENRCPLSRRGTNGTKIVGAHRTSSGSETNKKGRMGRGKPPSNGKS